MNSKSTVFIGEQFDEMNANYSRNNRNDKPFRARFFGNHDMINIDDAGADDKSWIRHLRKAIIVLSI